MRIITSFAQPVRFNLVFFTSVENQRRFLWLEMNNKKQRELRKHATVAFNYFYILFVLEHKVKHDLKDIRAVFFVTSCFQDLRMDPITAPENKRFRAS